jgi:hypothetical protein
MPKLRSLPCFRVLSGGGALLKHLGYAEWRHVVGATGTRWYQTIFTILTKEVRAPRAWLEGGLRYAPPGVLTGRGPNPTSVSPLQAHQAGSSGEQLVVAPFEEEPPAERRAVDVDLERDLMLSWSVI